MTQGYVLQSGYGLTVFGWLNSFGGDACCGGGAEEVDGGEEMPY